MIQQKNLHIFIGYDSREPQALNVAEHSILRNTEFPYRIRVHKLMIKNFQFSGWLSRPIERRGNQMWCPISNAAIGTEFTFTRFFVPYLMNHSGWAVFMDCDVVVNTNMMDILALADPKYAVMVVKHNYEPKSDIHMVDQIQTKYSRKNWSSVILWNCAHPSNKNLTFTEINEWPGRDLHGFKWLKDEEIGELPPEWNHLVDVLPMVKNSKILHFTLGGPWLPGWEPQKSDALWIKAYDEYISEPEC